MTQLEKFLKGLETKHCSRKVNPIVWEDFKKLSPDKKYEAYEKHLTELNYYYRKDNEKLFCVVYIKKISRRGKQYYPFTVRHGYIRIDKKGITCNNFEGGLLDYFKENTGIKLWKCNASFTSREYSYLVMPTIFKDILMGNVYNDETFYRSIARHCYRIKHVDWKAFKICLLNSQWWGINISDLQDFTVNFDNSLRIISKIVNKETLGNLQLISDMLRCSVKLDQKIDLNWSAKRMDQEHQKQIETLMEKDLASKDKTLIHENPIETKDVKCLNTEYDVFMEGKTMHHCIYTNYYNRIKDKQYVAYHIDSPEDCTLGIRFGANGVVLDQIYQKYDRCVSEETRNFALDFIKKHAEELTQMFSEKVTNNCENNYGNLLIPDLEIPW